MPNAAAFLKPGVTLTSLYAIANAVTDNQAATQVNQDRTHCFAASASDPDPPLKNFGWTSSVLREGRPQPTGTATGFELKEKSRLVRIGNREFAPTVFTTVVTVVLIAALLSLGRWQLERMRVKQALFAALAAGGAATVQLTDVPAGGGERYQHVVADGRYESAQQFLLDNMTHTGRAGYRVLTPLLTDAGRIVLVDRGWLPIATTRANLPNVAIGEEYRRIVGRLDYLPRAGIELATTSQNETWPRVLSYPRMSDLSGALQRRIDPQIILLDADQPAGFVREWRPSTFPPERHLGYAVTWFALAAALAVIYLVTNLRQDPDKS